MEKRLIGLGLGAGLLAGITSFAYARIQIAPSIATAIDYEEARSHAESAVSGGHSHEHEVFTRGIQENLGAGVGTIGFAIVTGALFAVGLVIALAVLRRYRVSADPRLTATLLAVGAFVSVCVVPWVVYPATLPGIGDPATAGARTTAYLALLAASLGLAAIVTLAALRLAPRLGGWPAGVAGAAGYLVAITAVAAVLPSYRETPGPLTLEDGTVLFPGFPADLLADFRVAALLCQAMLWIVLAATFVLALPRALRSRPETPNRTEVLSAHR